MIEVRAGDALTVSLADAIMIRWAQAQWVANHYLHRPIDPRCSALAYVVYRSGEPVGAIGFGRPESTVTRPLYGGLDDLAAGRVQHSRWSVLNMARVWLDPAIQRGGRHYIPHAASWAIAQCLRRVVVDYLLAYPVVFPDEPYDLRLCLSYCNFNTHRGTLYHAAGFNLARTNERGLATFTRSLRTLKTNERRCILQASAISERSRRYRARRLGTGRQLELMEVVS